MKKITTLFVILIFCLPLLIFSQPVLYGVSEGQSLHAGAIFKYATSTRQMSTVFQFPSPPRYPVSQGGLILAGNGKFYGLTLNGSTTGKNTGYGTIYSFDSLTKSVNYVYNFDTISGANPAGKLVTGPDGKLYGMTNKGGVNNSGTIFSFDYNTNTFTKIWDFTDASGVNPQGSLFLGKNGWFYGTASSGGSKYYGTIFAFDPATNTFHLLYEFDGTKGGFPFSSFIQASNGLLYTTCALLGANNNGSLVSLDPQSNVVTDIHDFNNNDGSYVIGNLVEAPNGLLYGTALQGGSSSVGTLFSFNTTSNIFTKLVDFGYYNGSSPRSNISVGADGLLYGMTFLGGSFGYGIIYSFNTETNNLVDNYNFTYGPNGGAPSSDLIQIGSGNFFGMINGGTTYSGVIFSYNSKNNTGTVLYDFNTVNPNGIGPQATLFDASDKKLYGTTVFGGTNGFGTIFSFDPVTNSQKTVYNNTQLYEEGNCGGFIEGDNHLLYAMVSSGGLYGHGLIFSFDPSTNTRQNLYSFDGTSGSFPFGKFLKLANGKFYALTDVGGTNNAGTIFSFDPNTNSVTTLFNFNTANGIAAMGSLIQARDGKLYGTAGGGGDFNNGVIFSFDPATNIQTKLFSFNSTSGYQPLGGLTEGVDGKLYGLTTFGGAFGMGTMFSFETTTGIETTLHDFAGGSDGSDPIGNLLMSKDGKLYGMTSIGGAKKMGMAFSYDVAGKIFNKIADFDATNGGSSYNAGFIEINSNVPPVVALTDPATTHVVALDGVTMLVQGTASDLDGSILATEIFLNGNSIGIDSTGNNHFNFTLNNLSVGNYNVVVKATDNQFAVGYSDTLFIQIIGCTGNGKILAEGFPHIEGSQISNLTNNPAYPNQPSVTGYLNTLEYNNITNDYGVHTRGFLCVPQTGIYYFMISAANQAELWITLSNIPASRTKMAYTPGPTKFREFTRYATQKSQYVLLQKGIQYPIETVHKANDGQDHLSVAWILPNGKTEVPIAGTYLSPDSTQVPQQSIVYGVDAFAKAMRKSEVKRYEQLRVNVAPNPSKNYFQITAVSSSNIPVSIFILDCYGRVLESKQNVPANGSYQMGNTLRPGMYYLELIEGRNTVWEKLIKQ